VIARRYQPPEEPMTASASVIQTQLEEQVLGGPTSLPAAEVSCCARLPHPPSAETKRAPVRLLASERR
jgi:hypothetical protein